MAGQIILKSEGVLVMRLNSKKLIYSDMGSSILYCLMYLIKRASRVKFFCHLKMILITFYLNCLNLISNRRPSFHPVTSTWPLVFQKMSWAMFVITCCLTWTSAVSLSQAKSNQFLAATHWLQHVQTVLHLQFIKWTKLVFNQSKNIQVNTSSP